jgi:hypothetical protein
MSQSTTRTLVRSGIIGGGVGLLLAAAVSLFAAPTMDLAQVADWNDPWSTSAEVQVAEAPAIGVRIAANSH